MKSIKELLLITKKVMSLKKHCEKKSKTQKKKTFCQKPKREIMEPLDQDKSGGRMSI